MQINCEVEQLSLFGPDTWCGKTSQEPSQAPMVRTFARCSRKSSELKTAPVQCLDLTPGHGNLLGQSYWELNSAWLGACWMLNTGVSPREERESSLSQILQADPPRRYYLSRTACLGILRRAKERGKELPTQLKAALMIQSGLSTTNAALSSEPADISADQQDKVCNYHDFSGALESQQSMKKQPFVAAGFSAGAGATAGSIAYQEELAPTLKGGASGNMMPSVLCLNDQGGQRMDLSEDVSGTLRADERGHQPLVYENHQQDARCSGPFSISPALSANNGTGGNNLPLVSQEPEVYCITGNAIDRQPQNGGNGIGYQADIAYTLTATDHHAVYSRQRVDVFKDDVVASTESARQHKDATDLVCQLAKTDCTSGNQRQYLIRRLTPLECERLQGFPDGWTDIPGASDSARYKALVNSVAIPCVEYVLRGIALALQNN